ncbi:hypothetical protein CR513_15760, partial [Mucuna pruriens]
MMDGSIERYKVQIVTKGYTQTYGDYEETFSPVAKLNIVRILLSLAANLDWSLHHDVNNAFLPNDLEEEVYMDIPPSYVIPLQDKLVCKLERAFNANHTLFLKHHQGKATAFIIYVDDMIITRNGTKEIAKIQMQLCVEFEIKNLGGQKYFLQIKVYISYEEIFISQRKYVLDLLFEVRMLDYKLYMQNPSERHMEAIIRILHYLKFVSRRGIMFSKNNHLNVKGYTNADWAGSIVVTNIAHNHVQHDHTKHIEIDRHFIKENLYWCRNCTTSL